VMIVGDPGLSSDDTPNVRIAMKRFVDRKMQGVGPGLTTTASRPSTALAPAAYSAGPEPAPRGAPAGDACVTSYASAQRRSRL
jgi:hypothetical protein